MKNKSFRSEVEEILVTPSFKRKINKCPYCSFEGKYHKTYSTVTHIRRAHPDKYFENRKATRILKAMVAMAERARPKDEECRLSKKHKFEWIEKIVKACIYCGVRRSYINGRKEILDDYLEAIKKECK